MLGFADQLSETESFEMEYKGEKINQFFKFDRKGETTLRFRFISVASIFEQAIILHLYSFVGKISLNGKPMKRERRKFPLIIFSEKDSPKEFELEISLEEGELIICNGSDRLGDCQTDQKIWCSIGQCCAMIIDKIDENHYRFRCNDHEYDDDFDDLIFEMDIIPH